MDQEQFHEIIWKIKNKRKLSPYQLKLIHAADEEQKVVILGIFNENLKYLD